MPQDGVVSAMATPKNATLDAPSAERGEPIGQQPVRGAGGDERAFRQGLDYDRASPSGTSAGVEEGGLRMDTSGQVGGPGEGILTDVERLNAAGVRESQALAVQGQRPYAHTADPVRLDGPGSPIGGERPPAPATGFVLFEPQMVRRADDPGWGDELGERVLWLVGRRESLVELRLNPPELGSLEIRVRQEKDAASVHILVQSGAAREALESASARLRELFGEAGLLLQSLDVSERQSGQYRGGQDLGPEGGPMGSEEERPSAGKGPSLASLQGRGLIDTYA
jgi:hypothetical protein